MEYFHHSQKKHCLMVVTHHVLSNSPNTWATINALLFSINVPICIFYINKNNILYFVIGFFTLHNVFKVCINYSMYQYFNLFYFNFSFGVKVTKYKIDYLKLYAYIEFNTFTEMWSNHIYQVVKHFCHPLHLFFYSKVIPFYSTFWSFTHQLMDIWCYEYEHLYTNFVGNHF